MSKIWACADLHGMLHLWRQIQEFCDKDDTIYVLGDSADRGPNPWETLKEVLRDSRVKYVRGNHDQMLLECWLNDARADTYTWYCNGGELTDEEIMKDSKREFYIHRLMEQPFKRVYTRPDGTKIHLTHAGFTLTEEGEYPDWYRLIWDRDHWRDRSDITSNDYVVCGHTPVPLLAKRCEVEVNESQTVARKGNKICIDGGCFATNKIVLLDLDTFEEVVFYG